MCSHLQRVCVNVFPRTPRGWLGVRPVMGLELADSPAQRRFADQDHPFEARLFNRPHKALGDGVDVRQ